ncbi:hypothetical protein [Ralstonia sp. UNC404CL21Col]|uniref:hypothetical protein n=1 Tax=Ralstonia sp. UNC404CL21Col TaxID=1380362 RepID=UPI00344FCD61
MYGNDKNTDKKRQREHSMKTTGIFLIGVCATWLAHGQTVAEREKQAYCQYVMDGAAAEKTLATGVQGLGRFGQSDSNPTEKQAVVGVSKSLSKHLQGNAAMRAAELDCRLYAQTVDLGRAVKYRMAAVDRDVATQAATAEQNSTAQVAPIIRIRVMGIPLHFTDMQGNNGAPPGTLRRQRLSHIA